MNSNNSNKKKLTLLILLFCLMIYFNFSFAEEINEVKTKKVSNKEKEKTDDPGKEIADWLETVKTRYLTRLQLSPDNRKVAFTVIERAGEKRLKNIWVLDLAREKARKFTTSKSDEHPRWSPDGNTLAFLSARGKKSQIYLLPMDGGEAEALTDSKTGVQSFQWSPHGTAIAFTSPDPQTQEEKKRKKEKDDAIVVDEDDRNALLRIIDVKTKKVRTLTKNQWRISEFQWMKNGDRLIVFATDNPNKELWTNRIFTISAKDGEMKPIAAPTGPFSGMKISPDGKTIAYLGARVDGPQECDIFFQPVSGGPVQNITGKPINRCIISFKWLNNSSILALAQTGVFSTFFIIDKNNKVKKIKPMKTNPSRSFAGNSREVVFVGQTSVTPPELWITKKWGPARQVTRFHEKWDASALIQPEVVRYKSFDEEEIEAFLYKPGDDKNGMNGTKNETKNGDRLPLVVMVHGGPSGRFSQRFNSRGQLLVSMGFAVLCPNIRGSTGYGYEFMIKNRRDWGGGDFKDVMAGVDFLINKGIAHPGRLGIYGWSYGGYMSAWAVTQTHRFKAAVSGAPMTDLAFEYGTELSSINAYDTWYLGTPYENLDDFIKMSPMTYVKNVRTPTLILCGENDKIDPVEQCQQFYRGLKRYGVDTQLVIYPREGHGIREKKHEADMLYRMTTWFKDLL